VHEVRKTVTVCFCDVTGSTALGERLDPESLRRVMARYFASMRQVVERHQGTVEKFIGDAVMAVFGVPVLHEDDALRAVRAAAEMREALEELNAELERDYGTTLALRIGLDTGEVVAGTEERLVTGDAVNVAARLEQAARPGETLLGEETLRLCRHAVEVEPLEPLDLRGKSRPIAAYRLIAVSPGTEPVRRRLEAPIIGRERERRLLADVWERVCSERSCQLFTLLGPAGVGKSRLGWEFLAALEHATVVRGRCLSYGEGITYWPVVELLKELLGAESEPRLEELGLDEAAVAALHALLAQESGPTSPEEIAWAVRKLLENRAAIRPLVCLLDDVHWGDETFLDLVEEVADLSRDAPILLLCLARPELLERRPGWAGGKLNATSVLLEPLSDQECGRLIENLIGRAELAAEVESRIVEGAEGNPLFVEEMLAMLIDDGLLVSEDGRWSAAGELTAVPVPPTIQALLAARLDRLIDEEREVIERASVEGKVFHRGWVKEAVSDSTRPAVSARLAGLVRKELIRPDKPLFPAGDAFRFRHLLIRDAAYDSIPKQVRSELHERHADWLESTAGEQIVEYEEIVGYHLEQAFRYRAELGPVDAAGQSLGRRAAERLGASGRRAFNRRDAPAAVNLISRAVSLLPPDDPARVDLIPNIRVIQGMSGDLSWAHAVLDEAISAGDERLEAHARVQQAFLRLFTEPEVAPPELIEVAEGAIAVLEQLGDGLGLARAWRLIGQAHYLARRAGGTVEASEQALVHARRAGDRFEEGEIVEWLAIALVYGPAPAGEAATRLGQLLEEVSADALLEAIVAAFLARLYSMQGKAAEMHDLVRRANRAMDEHGETIWLVAMELGEIDLDQDDPVAVERRLRPTYDALKRMDEKTHFSTVATTLANALYMQGRYEEADGLTRESERAARANDVAAQIEWRAARAKAIARKGDLEAARSLAREAVAFAAESDFLIFHGHALVALAEVLRLADRPAEAASAVEEAVARYEQKGDLASATKAHALRAELRESVPQ
jgi:class 3 adenylate cyclase/tetratricopeptide (TPR) repeat protein